MQLKVIQIPRRGYNGQEQNLWCAGPQMQSALPTYTARLTVQGCQDVHAWCTADLELLYSKYPTS